MSVTIASHSLQRRWSCESRSDALGASANQSVRGSSGRGMPRNVTRASAPGGGSKTTQGRRGAGPGRAQGGVGRVERLAEQAEHALGALVGLGEHGGAGLGEDLQLGLV